MSIDFVDPATEQPKAGASGPDAPDTHDDATSSDAMYPLRDETSPPDETAPATPLAAESWTTAGAPGEPSGARKGFRRPSRRYILFTLLVLLTLMASVGGGALGARITSGSTTTTGQKVTLSASVSDLQQAIENVSQSVQPSVVEITSRDSQGEAIGSGVILTQDGYILTNDHVVQGYTSYGVKLSDGRVIAAQIVGEGPQDDLAVLKIAAANLQPIAFADSSKAVVGQFVVAIGSPLGLRQSVTQGIVSALNRTASESPDGPATQLAGLIQTNAAINPGNSGGALVDLQGRLVGIPTLEAARTADGTDVDGVGFAIPANRARYVAEQLIRYGKLTATDQGYLGVEGQNVSAQTAAANGLSVTSGVLVKGFTSDASGTMPAQRAGIRTGDVITAVNGYVIADGDDLLSKVMTQKPGTRVTVTVTRGAGEVSLEVTLGERPVNAQG